MSSCLILPCAGSGARIGGQSKQLRLVAQKPLFIHSILAFVGLVDQIIIPCSDAIKAELETALAAAQIEAQLIAGGSSRLASVANALSVCPPDCDKVLIHDAVRPCVKRETIRACLDALDAHGAVLTAIPCSDTLKHVEQGMSLKTIDREQIYLAQTPQGFRLQQQREQQAVDVRAIYEAATASGATYTDDASICEAHGIPVCVIAGSRDNIKVTYAEDLPIAEFLLSKQLNS